MAAEQIRKNVNLFVDGKGYAGKIDNFRAPALAIKAEELRMGGMDTPIDIKMGLEKMTSGFALYSYSADVLALFGVANGQSVAFVAREALEDFDGTVTPVVHTMRGRILSLDSGDSKAGDATTLQIEMSLTYYKLQHGGRVLQEVDAVNMIHIVNGVDVLAAQRTALGI